MLISGMRPWLQDFVPRHLSPKAPEPDFSGCHAQVVEVAADNRHIFLSDGKHVILSFLSNAAYAALQSHEAGAPCNRLLGRVLAPVSGFVYPDTDAAPPRAVLILTDIRVFADTFALQPTENLRDVHTLKPVVAALRGIVARSFAECLPPKSDALPDLSAKEKAAGYSSHLDDPLFPPKSVRHTEVPYPSKIERNSQNSTRPIRHLSKAHRPSAQRLDSQQLPSQNPLQQRANANRTNEQQPKAHEPAQHLSVVNLIRNPVTASVTASATAHEARTGTESTPHLPYSTSRPLQTAERASFVDHKAASGSSNHLGTMQNPSPCAQAKASSPLSKAVPAPSNIARYAHGRPVLPLKDLPEHTVVRSSTPVLGTETDPVPSTGQPKASSPFPTSMAMVSPVEPALMPAQSPAFPTVPVASPVQVAVSAQTQNHHATCRTPPRTLTHVPTTVPTHMQTSTPSRGLGEEHAGVRRILLSSPIRQRVPAVQTNTMLGASGVLGTCVASGGAPHPDLHVGHASTPPWKTPSNISSPIAPPVVRSAEHQVPSVPIPPAGESAVRLTPSASAPPVQRYSGQSTLRAAAPPAVRSRACMILPAPAQISQASKPDQPVHAAQDMSIVRPPCPNVANSPRTTVFESHLVPSDTLNVPQARRPASAPSALVFAESVAKPAAGELTQGTRQNARVPTPAKINSSPPESSEPESPPRRYRTRQRAAEEKEEKHQKEKAMAGADGDFLCGSPTYASQMVIHEDSMNGQCSGIRGASSSAKRRLSRKIFSSSTSDEEGSNERASHAQERNKSKKNEALQADIIKAMQNDVRMTDTESTKPPSQLDEQCATDHLAVSKAQAISKPPPVARALPMTQHFDEENSDDDFEAPTQTQPPRIDSEPKTVKQESSMNLRKENRDNIAKASSTLKKEAANNRKVSPTSVSQGSEDLDGGATPTKQAAQICKNVAKLEHLEKSQQSAEMVDKSSLSESKLSLRNELPVPPRNRLDRAAKSAAIVSLSACLQSTYSSSQPRTGSASSPLEFSQSLPKEESQSQSQSQSRSLDSTKPRNNDQILDAGKIGAQDPSVQKEAAPTDGMEVESAALPAVPDTPGSKQKDARGDSDKRLLIDNDFDVDFEAFLGMSCAGITNLLNEHQKNEEGVEVLHEAIKEFFFERPNVSPSGPHASANRSTSNTNPAKQQEHRLRRSANESNSNSRILHDDASPNIMVSKAAVHGVANENLGNEEVKPENSRGELVASPITSPQQRVSGLEIADSCPW